MTTTAPHQAPARDWGVLAALLVLCVGGGGLIGVLFAGQTDAYTTYPLPPWAPPSWLFGPVWTVLYAAMSIAAWRVWLERKNVDVRRPLTLYVIPVMYTFLTSRTAKPSFALDAVGGNQPVT